MRRLTVIWGLLVCLAGWQCSHTSDLPSGPGDPLPEGCLSISSTRAQELMDKWPRLIILDARTPAEFHDAHIPGAIPLDVTDEIQVGRQLRQLDPQRPYLVYCQTGTRSRKACALLQAAGFRQIYHLQGGYHQWPKPD